MRVIGLTGGIGAGKSEVAATLATLGAAIIDADEEGHLAYRQGSIGWRRLGELFGESILAENGEIDRRALGELVFNSPQALAWLNAAIHPLIRQQMTQRLAKLRDAGTEVAVVDAALLYQAGWDDLTDEVWAVTAPVETVVERLAAQRGLQPWEAMARVQTQAPPEAVALRADVVIENTGELDALRVKVTELWNERILPKGEGRNGGKD